MAAENNSLSNATRRMDIAMQLFEAYSALSCCFISEDKISESMLPGLRHLLKDMEQLSPDIMPNVNSMIKEFEVKVNAAQMTHDKTLLPQNTNTPTPPSPQPPSGGGRDRKQEVLQELASTKQEINKHFKNFFSKKN